MPRTLFSKILIWSAAAQLIIVITLAGFVKFYIPESEDAVNNAWSLYAHDAVMLYEKMGPVTLQEFLTRTGEDTLMRLQLALEQPGATCQPAAALTPIADSGTSGGKATTTIKASGLDGDYCLTVHAKPTSLPETAASRRSRVQIAILFELLSSAALSYFIARYLSRPISELRRVSSQLALGDLNARVGSKFARRKDEAAELVREFDQMAERLSGLIETQHRLIADISHEIKSPLARLSMALGLARRSAEHYAPLQFDRMQSEVDRISLLATELLLLERIDSEDAMRVGAVEIAALTAEIIADACYESSRAQEDFVVSCPADLVIAGDANLLRRLIENLVRNAIFYTQPGTEIAIGVSRKGEDRVLIEIRDRGPGVPQASLPHLFEPFYRVDEARGRKTGGTGIGLAICERVVHLHHGTISAANATPHGLIVLVDLPLNQPAERPASRPAGQDSSRPVATAGAATA
jgi:two-component system sensor histidine kinase CpxA